MPGDENAVNPEKGSPFMQLPPEMRDEIYGHLFFSTRLAWGKRFWTRISSQRIASAPNPLALLRTCRQVLTEVGTTWLQQVLFSFESPEAMLDKLANIPTATLALIRYARVSGDALRLSWDDDDMYYRTSQVLKLLPGLALECLTVLGMRSPEIRYQTLDMLVRHGSGWKELRYIAHDSTFLAYQHDWLTFDGDPQEDSYLRVPQPAGLQRALEERDGAGSGASVTIYRATSRHPCSVLLEPATRASFAQTLPAGEDLRTFGTHEDAAVMALGEREKEVLVVVRRGRGVDYAEKEGSPYLENGDIREWMPGKTWGEIEADQESRFHVVLREEAPPVVDKYIHVDEYVWPPLHFNYETQW